MKFFLRTCVAFVGAWIFLFGAVLCFIDAARPVGHGVDRSGPTFLAGMLLVLPGTWFLVRAVTCAVYGTVRAIRQAEDRQAARATRGKDAQAELAPQRPMTETTPTITTNSPISEAPASPSAGGQADPPKPVRLVMRDPSGRVMRFPLRDPAKADHYRRQYESDGYEFIRIDPL